MFASRSASFAHQSTRADQLKPWLGMGLSYTRQRSAPSVISMTFATASRKTILGLGPTDAKALHTIFGDQPVYTHLDLADTTALASLHPDTADHWATAQHRHDQLRGFEVGVCIKSWLGQIIDLPAEDFTTLLTAAAWFRTNPASGLTVRSVPIPGMHTKWLARNRALVLACLNLEAVPPASDVDEVPRQVLDALGLRPTSPEIGVVLADPALQALVGGLRQITAPVHEITALPIVPDTVLIVENKDPAIAWPTTRGLAIIHGLGNHLQVLRQIPWIPAANTWYWGDLDRHGFTLLSRARSLLPGLRSIVMTPADITAYSHLGLIEKLTRYDPPLATLTCDETRALAQLTVDDGHLRIEQERIPLLDAVARLKMRCDVQP